MSRRPRQQPIGVPIHVIARGFFGQPVYGTTESKQHLLTILSNVSHDHEWCVLNWTVMTNHLHLVLSLTTPTLSIGMKQLIGDHAKWWNRRSQSTGHVYMGRFKSIPVEDDRHLRLLMRYVDLNPFRAGLVTHPRFWLWGGYSANALLRNPEPFHDAIRGRSVISSAPDAQEASSRYRRFVCDKVPQWARAGHEAEERPPLADILIPGRAETWSDACELWKYTTGDVARFYGVTPAAVRLWIAERRPPKPFPLRANRSSAL